MLINFLYFSLFIWGIKSPGAQATTKKVTTAAPPPVTTTAARPPPPKPTTTLKPAISTTM